MDHRPAYLLVAICALLRFRRDDTEFAAGRHHNEAVVAVGTQILQKRQCPNLAGLTDLRVIDAKVIWP